MPRNIPKPDPERRGSAYWCPLCNKYYGYAGLRAVPKIAVCYDCLEIYERGKATRNYDLALGELEDVEITLPLVSPKDATEFITRVDVENALLRFFPPSPNPRRRSCPVAWKVPALLKLLAFWRAQGEREGAMRGGSLLLQLADGVLGVEEYNRRSIQMGQRE